MEIEIWIVISAVIIGILVCLKVGKNFQKLTRQYQRNVQEQEMEQ